jgi:hypothetical protein
MNQFGYQDLLNQSTSSSDQSIIYNLILPNLDPNSVPYIDIDNTVQDRILGDGQLLIGSSGGAPVGNSLTGTTNEVIVTNGPGTITLSTPQQIATTSSPTFNNLNLTNSIIGSSQTVAANNIVSNTGSAISGHLSSFVSDKVIQDSGIVGSNIVTDIGTAVVGDIPSYTANKIIHDSGIAASTLVGGPFLVSRRDYG